MKPDENGAHIMLFNITVKFKQLYCVFSSVLVPECENLLTGSTVWCIDGADHL